ncbi:hypothetical protein [Hydrogenophaga crocea]|uniref:Uncharacterized protein n=1 Tax=Hydrogenophaga crocea TaxID=2716225 RepID=A0A6G8IEC5_9BURK|nr:hypothetical protein [Hydrogenophaga crocea]QIM51554.1 hypothetical protein G9Q37_05075 [Hydrogenophaga crocea]
MFKFGSTAKFVMVGHSNDTAVEKLITAAFLCGGNINLDLGCLQLIVPDDLEA